MSFSGDFAFRKYVQRMALGPERFKKMNIETLKADK
jgi:hypothetical protein